MTERARFRTVTLVLVGALILGVIVTVSAIQADLTRRTQAALASAGVAYYGLEFDGRDAVLGGFVPSTDEATRIVAIVRSVPGVRAVRNELIVERLVESDPAPPAVAPAELRLQRLGPMLVISGRVADSDATSIISAAQEAFGNTHVRSDLRVDSELEPSFWLADPAILLRIINAASETGRLSVRGEQAVLGGRIVTSADRRRINELAATIPGLRWRFDLFNGLGSAAGDNA